MPTSIKEKAFQQQVDLNNIYTTMQTFMGGYLVNYFNRFGRQWQTYVEAEGDIAHQYRRTSISSMCAARTAARCRSARWCNVKQITGPEFILRFNEYNAAQLNITGAPGYSSGQVRTALEEVFHQTMPAGDGLLLLRG